MMAIQARSRKYSMVQKPLNNHVLNFAIIFETVLALLIIYIPGNSEVSNTDREILSLISNFSLFRDSSWPPMYTPIWWLSRMAFSDIVHSLVLYSLAALNLSQEKTVSFR